MIGMNASSGRAIADSQHLTQSVADILTTPIGSRIMRRDYGSLIPDLIDEPLHGVTVLRLYAATAIALMRWEPRIRLSSVTLSQSTKAGEVSLELEGNLVNENEPASLTIPLRLGGTV